MRKYVPNGEGLNAPILLLEMGWTNQQGIAFKQAREHQEEIAALRKRAKAKRRLPKPQTQALPTPLQSLAFVRPNALQMSVITERAYHLVDTFGEGNGAGSHTCECVCGEHPACMCL